MKILAFAFTVLSTQSFARFAEPSLAYLAVDYIRQNVTVAPDGSFVTDGEFQGTILNEAILAGRNHFTQVYSSPVESFHVLEAKTIFSDQEVRVPEEMIEDKSLASGSSSMEDLHQVSVTFPSLVKHAKIYVRYRRKNTQVVTPGFFSWYATLADGQLLYAWENTITAPFPLFHETGEESGVFDIKKERKGKDYVVRLSLREPYYRAVIEEDDVLAFPEDYPWAMFSNTEDWSVAFDGVAADFDRETRKSLPAAFEGIIESVKKIPKGPKQLDALTDFLKGQVRYVGDMTRLEGLIRPRTMASVAQTGYGDCKDFSTALVAMARRLGYQATVALVDAGMQRTMPLGKLPSVSYFNHAVAQVKWNRKTYWLDGTAYVSYAEGIPVSIADRKALLLNPEKLELTHIDPIDSRKNSWFVKKQYEPDLRGELVPFEHVFEVKGAYALDYVGSATPEETKIAERRILSHIENIDRVASSQFKPFDLTSRIYRDLRFHINGKTRQPFLRTTSGNAYSWNSGNVIDKLTRPDPSRVSHLYLGVVGTQRYDFLLKNVGLTGKPVRCEVQSPWFRGTRLISDVSEGLRLVDHFEVKVPYVSYGDLNSSQYRRFRTRLEKCFSNLAVLFHPKDRRAPPPPTLSE